MTAADLRTVLKEEISLSKGLNWLVNPDDKTSSEISPGCYKCGMSYSVVNCMQNATDVSA
jgi:hypothetical protein